MTRTLLLASPLALLVIVAGCSTPVSFSSWQKDVEEYISLEANGDANSLRDITWDDRNPGFAVMSDRSPEASTDIKGLLIAHQQIGSRRRYVFLVAQVQNHTIQDIRVAALSSETDQLEWGLTPANPESLRLYLASADPRQPFPRETDTFNLSTTPTQLILLHTPSGARWTLPLN